MRAPTIYGHIAALDAERRATALPPTAMPSLDGTLRFAQPTSRAKVGRRQHGVSKLRVLKQSLS